MDIRLSFGVASLFLMSFPATKAQQPRFGGELAKWQIRILPNLARGGEIIVASVGSNDKIATRTGPEAPTLLVRCSEAKLSIVIGTKAMGKTEREGNQTGVRFTLQNDSKPPRTVTAMESDNRDAFLLRDAESEIAKIAKSKILRMSFQRFQGDRVSFGFDLGGFDESRKELRRLCPAIP